jgi:hypothetical protein
MSKNTKVANDCAVQANRINPNIYIQISDELEELKRRYSPEQIMNLWNDAYPKLLKINQDKIIVNGTSEIIDSEINDIYE